MSECDIILPPYRSEHAQSGKTHHSKTLVEFTRFGSIYIITIASLHLLLSFFTNHLLVEKRLGGAEGCKLNGKVCHRASA